MDLSRFQTIRGVKVFDSEQISNYDYVVEKVDGRLYRIEYEPVRENRDFLYVNAGFFLIFVLTIALLIYLYRTVIRPFGAMTDMTYELAKGNLMRPIREEKSRFFGKFLWGMDMLREKLEGSRKRELEYQRDKKTMLLSLSHDIKTPLSAIELYSKALAEDIYETEEEKKDALRGISEKTKEIKGYVDQIYQLSRNDFLELRVEMGECYLSEVLKPIEAYYQEKLGRMHTEFTMEEIAPDDAGKAVEIVMGKEADCLLSGDRDRLVEALQNLMENAIKYGDGKRITIRLSEEEDCKLITVENTGCTLEEKELTSLFDSFYRGSNAANIEGNGLGLYIVQNLLRKMDGDAFVSVAAGKFQATLVIRKA
ncbi:MAG: HAMP domain-containing histidine kinase [Bacilli bacterium]|nr:HAMP domain-containing histidine kinase [Bacilli bacterium]